MNSTPPVRPDLAAIILAAGASSRMGRLKPLLPLAGASALERTIRLFRDAGVSDVVVVVGNRANELRPIIEGQHARCVVNPRWQHGMYSSVVSGVEALLPTKCGAFILPVDVPLIRASTILQLISFFDSHPLRIVYPQFDGRRGHPPLVSRAILDQAVRNAAGTLRALLLAHEAAAVDVPVADEAIHLDMDTPADFEALQTLASRRDIPSAAECEALLINHKVPEAVVRHSRKVAEVAGRIAEALLATGIEIDVGVVQAGAMLHDLCKGQPGHAEAGAATLRNYSMLKVADVVAAHTDMEFSGIIDERAVVYLADKLAGGDRLVTIDERFRVALNRFCDDPKALVAARRRKSTAEQIACAFESRIGMPLIEILSDCASSTIPDIPEVAV